MPETKILLVDDEKSARYGMRRALASLGSKLIEAANGGEALDIADAEGPDLVIMDIAMPEMDGLEALEKLMALPDPPLVIMVTAHGSEKIAVDAMKKGAYDYIAKPYEVDELRMVARNALEKISLERENRRLAEELKKREAYGEIVGTSDVMREVFDRITKVYQTDVAVLIEGESGTGKELVAKAIHNCSTRSDKPFVAINCGGIPENLLESELFGHVKGAFTGAISHKDGLFKVASGGSLFLDEIGETSMALQVKLLRVLDEMKIRPVGSATDFSVDVRLISATNKDLEKVVSEGKFREDFYYRLNVIPLYVPSLRERREDILLLARHFLGEFRRRAGRKIDISQETEKILEQYRWPGNVRELENVIERAAALCNGGAIGPHDLPRKLCDSAAEEPYAAEFPSEGIHLNSRVEAFERSLIKQAMKRTSNSQTKAARLLRLSPRSLRYKLEKYNMKGKEN